MVRHLDSRQLALPAAVDLDVSRAARGPGHRARRGPVIVAVLTALALTGALSARIGGGNIRRGVSLLGGALGLAVTYGIGHLLGTTLS
ncbi:MAG: rane protein [Pseudonocardiales bacterium]|nr:rane protein [Pseudonocardiales bacterium]